MCVRMNVLARGFVLLRFQTLHNTRSNELSLNYNALYMWADVDGRGRRDGLGWSIGLEARCLRGRGPEGLLGPRR